VITAKRLPSNPILRPFQDARVGANLNGPSLIRVPDWVKNPLGRYYLYFGHHKGSFIRMAYANNLEGPWRVHAPGVLSLEDTIFRGHIASPDVHIDHAAQRIVMYYHGPGDPNRNRNGEGPGAGQKTTVALSSDGLEFISKDEVLGDAYFRVFEWGNRFYAVAMPGVFYASEDGLTGFSQGPTYWNENMRHSAVLVKGDRLHVFYSSVGDTPEHILLSTIHLTDDWNAWTPTEPVSVLRPDGDHEGGDLTLRPSVRGWAPKRVRECRDPGIFTEGGKHYLLYSVAGEYGIAIAELSGL